MKKDTTLSIRISTLELNIIRANAEKAHLSQSEYVTRCCLGQQVVVMDGLREFYLHTLRHYFVTTLLRSGVDKQTVAELAGHGDTSLLERTYCHPQMELKRHASEVMTQSLLAS